MTNRDAVSALSVVKLNDATWVLYVLGWQSIEDWNRRGG